jgi:hypothetical protein
VKPLDLAIALWPELADLQYLIDWTWERGAGTGSLAEVGLCGYRQLPAPSWMDVIWIFGPDDAHGVRAMIDGDPTWEMKGPVGAVLIELAALPLPGQPGAPLEPISIGPLPTSTTDREQTG